MTRRSRKTSGFTLIELMLTLVILSIVMGATIAVFRSQIQSFRLGGERMDLFQNMRYALTTVDRVLRTAGSGVANQQPMFIYGGNSVVAFNSNYTAALQDFCAVNVNPDASPGSFVILPVASAYQLPNTGFTYPAMTYVPTSACLAETVSFYFRPDSSTTDIGDDFVLMQRVNALPAERVARNIMAYPGRPFFEYFVHRRTMLVPPATRDSLVIAGTAGSGIVLPIIHSVAIHGSPTDSAGDPSNSYLADSVKAVRINLRVSNGLTGAAQRVRDISTTVSLPNNGLVQLKTCGTPPVLLGPLAAAPNVAGDPPAVTLQWPASFDEASGETDVNQYNIYRRLLADPAFGSAVLTVPAGQPPPYVLVDNAVETGIDYVYAVGAQDCTPSESVRLNSVIVRPN
ncbi:MAG: prepilin-type N-terminal cleavage/methylation domain-containing protein [Gemmatimonadales bacterium]|nr:prepilin-type N-terminal cleavage/methylation domain-containing protein [Gemmatimonadales bacterium]